MVGDPLCRAPAGTVRIRRRKAQRIIVSGHARLTLRSAPYSGPAQRRFLKARRLSESVLQPLHRSAVGRA